MFIVVLVLILCKVEILLSEYYKVPWSRLTKPTSVCYHVCIWWKFFCFVNIIVQTWTGL